MDYKKFIKEKCKLVVDEQKEEAAKRLDNMTGYLCPWTKSQSEIKTSQLDLFSCPSPK